MEKIVFTETDGTDIEFYIEEHTRVNGYNYLLVSDSEEDEAEAYILKDLSQDGEEDSQYVMVEDELELEAISRVFNEMLEDVKIEL
jgi:Protein of unknown function (DUF1292).